MITDKEYEECRRLSFKAYALLARQGFVVPPSYIEDVMHGFLLEEWRKVTQAYDPTKGSRDTLVFGAFVRYARKAIMRIQRLGALDLDRVPAAARDAIASGTASDGGADSAHDHDIIRRALRELDEGPCRALTGVLAGDSLRSIAADMGVSRHRVEQYVGEAIMQIACRLDRPHGIRAEDWAITEAMFEGRPVSLIAQQYECSCDHIRATHRANIRLLINRLIDISRSTRRGL